MKHIIISFVLASVFCLSACSDDDVPGSEYNGLYEMTLHQTKSDCSADTWTDQEITAPYFRLEAQSLLGVPVIGWSDCTAPDPATCEDSIGLATSFALKDGVWQQHMTVSSFSNGECNLSYRHAILEDTPTGIRWEGVTKTGSITVADENACEPELAEQREDELECQSMSYYEADKL
jgi:hypothetical protein